MQTVVVDSSVITKWVNQTNEKDIELADRLLNEVKEGNVQLIAPELAKYEVGNVLIKKKLTFREAKIAFTSLYSLPIIFVRDSEELAKNTHIIATDLKITYYDASFIALAKEYKATLITENIKHLARSKEVNVRSLEG